MAVSERTGSYYKGMPWIDAATPLIMPNLIDYAVYTLQGALKRLPVDGDPYTFGAYNQSQDFYGTNDIRDTMEFSRSFPSNTDTEFAYNWDDAIVDRTIDCAKAIINLKKYLYQGFNTTTEYRSANISGWYNRGGVCDWRLGDPYPDCAANLPIVNWDEHSSGNTCAAGATGSMDYHQWNGIDDKYSCVSQSIITQLNALTWNDISGGISSLTASGSRSKSASYSYVGGGAMGETSSADGSIALARIRLNNFNFRSGKIHVFAYTSDDLTDTSFTDLRGFTERNVLKSVGSFNFTKGETRPAYYELTPYTLPPPTSITAPSGWVDNWWDTAMSWSGSEGESKKAVSVQYVSYIEPTWEVIV